MMFLLFAAMAFADSKPIPISGNFDKEGYASTHTEAPISINEEPKPIELLWPTHRPKNTCMVTLTQGFKVETPAKCPSKKHQKAMNEQFGWTFKGSRFE